MKFRKLRIAWSVFWGLACVLLVVLWVRSYQRHEGLYRVDSANNLTGFGWQTGTFGINYGKIAPTGLPPKWTYFRGPAFARYQGFHGEFGKGEWIVHLPFWFLALLAGAMAAISSLPRSFRFSLRTLLIAKTLVAVVLEFVVYASR